MSDAVRVLGSLLYRQRPEAVFDATVRKVITAGGPVVEQWRQTLTPVEGDELKRLRPTRRFAQLLASDISPASEAEFGTVAEAQAKVTWVGKDRAGRLTVEFAHDGRDSTEPLLATEWPTGQPEGWNDSTVIAADPASNGTVGLTA
ncbi:hypothetical protein ACWDUI_02550 [Streptosporangium sandarakinum]